MSNQAMNFRAGEPDDLNMILSDWLKSYRDSSFAKDITNAIYFDAHQKLIKKVLMRANVICAVNPEDRGHVFGWVCFETQGPYSVLHYFYVKQSFRGFGVGRNLFGHVRGNPFIFTHKTESFQKYEHGGFYSPYHFLGE